MTQHDRTTHISPKPFHQRYLFAQGLAWLGGLGILGGGMAIAQSQPAPESAVPSAQDLLLTPAPSEPVAAPAPAAPAPAPVVAPEPAPSVAPQPAVESVAPVVSQPDVSSPSVEPAPNITLPNPINSSDDSSAGSLTSPQNNINNITNLDNLDNLGGSVQASPVPSVIDSGNAYIDSTDYSIGATTQPSIVLSERSTGCQTVLQAGQSVPASVCGSSGVTTAAAASGTTAKPVSGNSVSLGPVTFSASGMRVGGSTPSGGNYYNLSVRPTAFVGNGNTSLMFPLSIPAAITSVFGWRIHPISGSHRFHSGTDLGAPMGTPVLAAFEGKVAIADFMRGYGLTVVLQHDKATKETLYAHLSEIFVQPGEWVEQGTVIGRVGSTGLSTGPHLHFEVRQLTPEGWLAMDPGEMLTYALANFMQSPQLALANLAGEKTVEGLQLINWAVPTLEGAAIDLTKVEVVKEAKPQAPTQPES
jgi:murein DD-endopeptidase MepM/ murein hydrolase activator NlpD